MLRTIMNRHSLPSLINFNSANGGVNVVPSFGANLGTYTRPGAGINQLALARNFHRTPIVVSSPGSDVAAGGYCVNSALPTLSTLAPQALDESGVADDGTIYSLALGWRSASTDLYALRQSLRSVLDRPRYIGAKVLGAATATFGIGAPDYNSIATNGAGDYTLTLRKNYGLIPTVVATMEGSVGGLRIEAISRESFQIKTYDAAGTPAHRNFYLHCFGTDSLAEHHTKRRMAKATHLKPELFGLRIEVAAGAPSLTVGGAYGTITDNNPGDYTFNLTTLPEVKRELIPIAMTRSGERLHIENADTNSFDILVNDAAGTTPTDPSSVDVICLAYGQGDEFYQG